MGNLMEGVTYGKKSPPLSMQNTMHLWLTGKMGAQAVERPRTHQVFSSGRGRDIHHRRVDRGSDSLLYHRQGALEPRSR